ncbi:branched-chain amino acid ABC transporter permease [Anaerosporomusa subterranea]|uniref:Branched-chain amino acid ABC transporter permease n=1 Tax=Anaerosporomusa subterranea TaxID=1794912 RepID=A0A154BXA0_ANASB|nr:branched-chain amino acid ABC transporter permease [Anaerosporomusa subterranea]
MLRGRYKLNSKLNRTHFVEGLTAGIPIALGYIPIAVTFGLLARSADLPFYIPALMSFFVFAGASQFIGVNLLSLGVSHGEIILTTFILNLRHFLMSAAISQKIPESVSKAWRAVLAFGITDETFTIAALRQEESLSRYFVLGLNTIAFAAWNAGTWIGLFFSSGLPAVLQSSMGIALYAMFIGLLIPSCKQSRSALVVALLAASIHSLIRWLPVTASISGGWGIIFATLISAGIGAYLFTEEN